MIPHPRCSLLMVCSFGLFLATCPNPLVAGDPSSSAPGAGVPDVLDDVWQQRFSAWGLDPANDEDDDGATNIAESIAGTDPRDAKDRFRVRWLKLDTTSATLGFTGEQGK